MDLRARVQTTERNDRPQYACVLDSFQKEYEFQELLFCTLRVVDPGAVICWGLTPSVAEDTPGIYCVVERREIFVF